MERARIIRGLTNRNIGYILIQTTIRLPTELKEQLQKEADRRGDSFNETVIRLLLRGLESQSSRADPHTE